MTRQLKPTLDGLASIPEAAKLLGVSKEYAYDLAKRGEFPGAIKIGSRWRVSLRRLEYEIHGDLAGHLGETEPEGKG